MESRMSTSSGAWQGKGQDGADQAWLQFAGDLALCLADLDEDDYLIIERKRADHYVQFAGQGAFGMRAEAMCNAYVHDPDAALTEEDYQHMRGLGWKGATETPGENVSAQSDPDGSPNFFIDAGLPVDFAALAGVAVATFREIYHVRHPKRLQYSAFSSDKTQIRFPTLRIKRGKR
jgi:hypothetical protein